MIRPLLVVGLLACLVVAAPSAASEAGTASYIVVFKGDAVRAAGQPGAQPLVATAPPELVDDVSLR